MLSAIRCAGAKHPRESWRRVFFPYGVLRTMTDHLDLSGSTTPPTPDQWDAIARFLAGESSAGAAADIRQWLSEHPGDAQAVATIDGLLPPCVQDARQAHGPQAGTLQFGRPIDVEAALLRVHAQMETTVSARTLTIVAEPERRSVKPTGVPPKRSYAGVWWAAAAAVVAAVGVSQWRASNEGTPAAPLIFIAHIGSRDSVILSDGSRVILAPGSKLTVAANYGQGQRNVELQGDAQFTVVHDATRPFSVRSGAAMINDLGTVFTVKAVAGKGVVVAVTEGSVSLRDLSPTGNAKAVTLAAGDRGRLNTDGKLVSERGSVTPDDSAWVVGKLVYRDASLAEVQADLRRWFRVELVVSDSAWRGRSIQAQALTTEPVEKFVERLTTMWGAPPATKSGDTLFVDRLGDRSKH